MHKKESRRINADPGENQKALSLVLYSEKEKKIAGI